MSDNDPKLSDADAQKVLARALDLQSRGADFLTVAQVREIAKELAIPDSAVDQALAEFRVAPDAVAPTRPAATPARSERRRVARVLTLSLAVLGGTALLLLILTMAIRSTS
jgi:hypothetical protein